MNVIGELRAAGCAFAEREAELLEEAASGPDLEDLVRRRCAGEPLEHLLGWVEFRGRRLLVGPGVFVPRRRTELLSELADGSGVLVELCCGAGPVAATAASAKAYAADIDRTAREIRLALLEADVALPAVREFIAKVKENNGNISQTAKELGIPMNTLANWQRKADIGVLTGTQNYNPELIAALDEIKDLKKQLKIAQEEREILKKATAYFAKNQ